MEDWLKSFYTQTDPVKRQQLLLENTREMEKEADQLRKQLFEARYGKGKPRKDAFMGCLMNLKYIAESVKRLSHGNWQMLHVYFS